MTDITPVLCKARTSAWWLRVILSCVRCWAVANQRRRRWDSSERLAAAPPLIHSGSL